MKWQQFAIKRTSHNVTKKCLSATPLR
uniref:Uncharacterized protein n=1 Tax=Anguilla anguilla TaxID=7936 RepID=A0A0E9VAZ7_ANGAN